MGRATLPDRRHLFDGPRLGSRVAPLFSGGPVLLLRRDPDNVLPILEVRLGDGPKSTAPGAVFATVLDVQLHLLAGLWESPRLDKKRHFRHIFGPLFFRDRPGVYAPRPEPLHQLGGVAVGPCGPWRVV